MYTLIAKFTKNSVLVTKNARRPLHERSPNKEAATINEGITEPEADAKARRAKNRKLRVKARLSTELTSIKPLLQQHPASLEQATINYLKPLVASENVDSTVEDFQAWTDERSPPLQIEKQGEGSFGEVYRATYGEQSVILKLIPMRAQSGQGSRKHTTIQDALSEVQLLARMREVPGFVDFRSAQVVSGRLPKQFLAAWDKYKRGGEVVEAKNPNYLSTYPVNQLWLLIEMGDAGRDLDRYRPRNTLSPPKSNILSVQRSWDIFWQVARALAKGEIHAQFEHRDLHLGNICIKDRRAQADTEDLRLVSRYHPTPFKLDHTGLEVTIIDYTLARATLEENHVVFKDLSKEPLLFEGTGDIQFDIYRHMRDVVGTKFGWMQSRPMTNVMWLYFVMEQLLRRTAHLSQEAAYETDKETTVTAKMKAILVEVWETIDVHRKREWEVLSATELIGVGTTKGWFLTEDIMNH